MGVCLVLSIPFVIKRGRDFGQPAKASIAFWLLGSAFPVVWPILLGVYVFKKPTPKADELGPVPPPVGFGIIPLAILAYAWPWMAMTIWCRI